MLYKIRRKVEINFRQFRIISHMHMQFTENLGFLVVITFLILTDTYHLN